MADRNLDLTVNVTQPHPGASHRVRLHGPGATELRAALSEIIGRYTASNSGAILEIDRLFEAPPSAKEELIATLDDIIGNAAKARRLLENT